MVSQLVQSFLLGLIITAVPGTVFIETVRRVLINRKSVVVFLIGNVVGVTVTVSIVVLGITAMALDRHTSAIFYAMSGLVLMLIGLLSLRARPDLGKKRVRKIELRGLVGSFVSGFVLATLNPASIAFWIVMIGRFTSMSSSVVATLANIVSINIGAIACYIALVSVVGHFKTKLSNQHLIIFSRTFGSLIVVFGILSLFKGIGLLS